MSFPRVKAGGWAVNEILTSAQQNTLDIDHSNSFDIRSAQTNSVASITTLTGVGRIIPAIASGADANSTITIGSSNNLVRVSSLTANRSYTMSTTGAQSGDTVMFFIDPSVGSFEVTIKDQSSATMFVLGNLGTSDGQWCDVFYDGSVWRVLNIGQGSRFRTQQFTSNGTFSVPVGVTQVLLVGCGAGAGGGGGARPDSANIGNPGCGGGGGGGSLWGTQYSATTPLASISVVVGGGGSGGNGASANNTPGLDGNDGGDTVFNGIIDFPGAKHGGGGFANGSTNGLLGLGGANNNGMAFGFPQSALKVTVGGIGGTTTQMLQWTHPSYGGNGGTSGGGTAQAASGGQPSAQAITGGTGGSTGTTVTNVGGYGGGGGGGGCYAPSGVFTPGNGGNGGNGSATVASAGSAGTTPSSVFGAGGGGGGAGGQGTTTGNGGNGGNGSGGVLFVCWVK